MRCGLVQSREDEILLSQEFECEKRIFYFEGTDISN